MRRLRAWLRSPGLWLLVVLSFAYAPLFEGRIVFLRDPAFWNYPARFFVSRVLRQGHFPHWNPFEGLGMSVWANPLFGLLYPPNWLFVLVPDPWVATLLTWESFAHNVWGGLGLTVLARRIGCGRLGALIAGLAWALGGHTTSMWSAGLLLWAGAWVPWCAVGFLALRSELDDPHGNVLWGVVKAAVPLAMSLLMGEVFVALLGIGFAVLTLGTVEALGPPRVRGRWRLGLWLALAGVLGTGVGAAVVVPAWAAVGTTERGAPLTLQQAETYSVHPARLLEFAAPRALGDPYGDYPAAAVVGEPRIDGRPLAYGTYLGASVLLLTLFAFGKNQRLGVALAVLAVATLLVAFGKHTPVHAMVRTLVPPLARMRYPEKYLAVFTCWAALLAGFGADRVAAGTGPRPWRRGLMWLACLLGAGLLIPRFLPAAWAAFARGGLVWAVVASAGGVAALVILPRWAPRFLAPVLVLGVAIDLCGPLWDLQRFTDSDVAQRQPPAAAAIAALELSALAPPRVYRADVVQDALVRLGRDNLVDELAARAALTLIPNLSTTYGLAAVPGYDAAIPSRFLQLWERARGQAVRGLRLFGVGYAVLPAVPDDGDRRRAGFEPLLDPFPGVRLYHVFEPSPRVFLAGAARVVPDDEALDAVFTPPVVVGDEVLLAPGGGAPLAGDGSIPGTCVLTEFEAAFVKARCEGSRAAYAVFAEQWDAGWHATVDGHAAPVERANVVMRAVALPPGTHTVTLSFWPPGLTAGLVVTLMALAGLVGLAVASVARRGLRDPDLLKGAKAGSRS